MGISAHYRKPKTSKPEPGHKIYPCLLRSLKVERANQAGHGLHLYPAGQRLCLSGFAYLTGTRRVHSWRLSITMDTSFCIEAVQEALEKYGSPDIFNTDQVSQFTSDAFTSVLRHKNIAISMDGKGAWAAMMSLSRGYGDQSNTKKSISRPMPA